MDVTAEGVDAAREAAAVLALSHADYPAFRYLLPDPQRRQRFLVPFMTAAARDTARHGMLLFAREGGRALGVALWMPPGAWPAPPGRKLRMLPGITRAMLAAGRRAPIWMKTGAALDARLGGDPAWYLLAMGVDPKAQRRGIGAKLLRPILDRDATCRLHTSDPANIGYYERFGFVVDQPMEPLFDGGPSYAGMVRVKG